MFLTHPTLVQPVQNERESYLDLLRKIDIPAVYKKTYYYLSGEEKSFLDLFLERHSISPEEEVIVLAPGGGDNAKSTMITKRWPVGNYVDLIKRFQSERNCRIILAGGPGDRTITNNIIQFCPDCLDATDLSFGDMASGQNCIILFVIVLSPGPPARIIRQFRSL
jgi:ADP-heptose:LPS heptosyltransferase